MGEHPEYVELSDRKIIEWAKSSGHWQRQDKSVSNDKPAFNYGIPALDDFSVRKLMMVVSSAVPRNYVVMEVKANLLAVERKKILQRFSNAHFKKVAQVVMGEPS